MGICVELYVGPRTDAALSKEAFCALLKDLFEKRAVAPPFAVVSGGVRAFFPSGMGFDGKLDEVLRRLRPAMRVESFGSDPDEIIACVERIYDTCDLCVWFASLDGKNEKMKPVYDDEDCCECWVGLYALREPQTIKLVNAYDDSPDEDLGAFRCYLNVSGKRAPDATSLPKTYFRRLLGRHFGPKLRAGNSYC
jgi:hypothetical protein